MLFSHTPESRRRPSREAGTTPRPEGGIPSQARRHPTRGLTEGAILAALTVVVGALGLVAPFVGILLAPLPIMLLVIRWGVRTAVLATVVAALVLLQFFGPLNAVSITAMFAPLGLALGWGVWRGIGAQLTILAGAAAFLASTVGALAVTTIVLHQDLVGQFIKSQVQAMEMALAFQQKIGANPQQVEEMRKTITVLPQFLHTALPVMFGLGALIWAYLCYTLARAVLRRIGHILPAVPPVLTWRVPPLLASVLLWIAGGLSIMSLRIPQVSGASMDAMLVDVFVFGFQGALVGIVWMTRRQIPRFMIVVAGVLLLSGGLLPMAALAILGVLDTWFDFRRGTGVPTPPASEPDTPGAGARAGGDEPAAAEANPRGDPRGARRAKAVHPQ